MRSLEKKCLKLLFVAQSRQSLLYDGAGREGQPSLLGLVDAASLVEPESNL